MIAWSSESSKSTERAPLLRYWYDNIKRTDQKLGRGQRQPVGEAFVPRLRGTEQALLELRPLVQQVQVVLPRVADRAVKGERGVPRTCAGRGDLRLRGGR